jgi:hypothetical protein
MAITNPDPSRTRRGVRTAAALICTAALLPGNVFALGRVAQDAVQQQAAPADATPIPADQLDALVAPIALYPDPLLAQVLAASTYPLELLQLHQWLAKNPGLKDKALADAAAKQPWDASIQAMAGLPDVVKRLADDVQWTADLGNAFLAQQADVMKSVQRMRQRAHEKGTLKTTPEQTVASQVVGNEPVIIIEQSNPEIVYVPAYDPLSVWGPWAYPYPPIYYPPYAGAAIAFGTGIAIGAIANGGWGWGAGWGDNDLTINHNNSFNRNTAVRGGNTSNRWQHRPEHRGGAPYGNRATANRYGGTARGDSLSQRQAGARDQVQRQGGNVRSGAVGTSGVGERAGSGGLGERASSPGSFSGGADRIGSQDLSRGGGSSNRGAFGDSGGFSGSSARSGSSRGGSSMRGSSGGASRGGGGMSRGGGGSRGGGRR